LATVFQSDQFAIRILVSGYEEAVSLVTWTIIAYPHCGANVSYRH